MTKRLQKSFHDCLSKFKGKNSSTNWIFSGSKHSKAPSFSIDPNTPHSQDGKAATLSDIDRFLSENFSSLYHDNDDNNGVGNRAVYANGETSALPVFLFESPNFVDPVPEIRSTSRFFVSPHLSASLAQEAKLGGSIHDDAKSTDTSSTVCRESVSSMMELEDLPLHEETIAVLTSSPDPYSDFRRSMEEMIEARLNQNQSIDWDFLEELLFCYLKLNDKKAYKYVLGAFVDLTTSIRQPNLRSERKNPSMAERKRRNHVYY